MTYDEEVRYWVERYLAVGWPIIIIPHGQKSPRKVKGWQLERPTLEDFIAAFPCGVGSLMGQPAGGVIRVDPDCPEMLRVCAVAFTDTKCVMTRDGSPLPTGYFYTLEGEYDGPLTVKDPTGKGEEATVSDLIWTGKQTILPPSAHPDGGHYRWVTFNAPTRVGSFIFAVRFREAAAAALLARHWPDGGRHDATMAVAGGLIRAGWESDRVADWLRLVLAGAQDEEEEDRIAAVYTTAERIEAGGDAVGWPRLEEMVDRRVIRRVCDLLGVSQDKAAARSKVAGDLRATDLGNAERFAAHAGGLLRWCPGMKQWLFWTGEHWRTDDRNRAGAVAIEVTRRIYDEAAAADTKEKRQALAEWAVDSESARAISAMLTLAKTIPALVVTADQLDVDPWVLNTRSGVVDLRTGRIADHDPADLLTHITAAAVGTTADCPRWLRFIQEVFGKYEGLPRYIQKVAGLALTGSIREEILFLMVGGGANGKSKFLAGLRIAYGTYAATTPFDTFDASAARGGPGNDLAALRGKRMVTAIELDQERHLAEARVKSITGGDPISCRFLYGEYFEYVPEYKLFLAVNHKPIIRGTDHGIWRRIHMIPFTETFEGENRERDLEEIWERERDGILAWALEGLRDYLENGLQPPEVVLDATRVYRVEMDVLADFLAANTEDGQWEVSGRDLYLRYTYWAKDYGERQLSSRMFSLRLAERGYIRRKSNGTAIWGGLRLRPETFGGSAATPKEATDEDDHGPQG